MDQLYILSFFVVKKSRIGYRDTRLNIFVHHKNGYQITKCCIISCHHINKGITCQDNSMISILEQMTYDAVNKIWSNTSRTVVSKSQRVHTSNTFCQYIATTYSIYLLGAYNFSLCT